MRISQTPQMNKTTGFQDGYSIVQWSYHWDPSLSDLVSLLPELVLEKRIVVASCDSGNYVPGNAELAGGWTVENGIAVSPEIQSVSQLPTPGFDEWYVHESKPYSFVYSSFVNTYGFSPLALNEEKVKDFWRQVDATRPLHVLGAGTPVMFFATRDPDQFEKACRLW